MEDDILDSLEDLGYNGPFVQEGAFEKAIEEGPKSIIYTQVVEWLSKELKILCKLEDHVNAISNPDDSSSFLLEVSSFLKELCCPYTSLTEGPVSQRLLSKESRLQLIDFLSSELLAARMVAHNKPESKTLQVEIAESPTASDLKTMLIALGFPKPPQNITPQQLFNKVEVKVKDLIAKVPPKLIGKPFFTGVLSDKQWHLFESLFKEMFKEYQLRREMLLKRLDVTIQSFKWSDKAKVKENQIAQVFMPIRKLMVPEPSVMLGDLLAAREDLAIMEKISTASVRKNTSCAVNKVLIGKVPDRGGRPNEQQPPPPEMPSWQKRSDGGNRGDGNRGGGSGSDRGRIQGGWSGGGGRGGGGGGGRGGGGGGGGGGQGYQGNNNQYASRDNYNSWGGGGGGGGGGFGGGVPVYATGMPVYVAQPQVAYGGQGGYQTGGYQSGGYQSGGYQTDNYQTGGYQGGGHQGGGGGGGGYGGGQGRGGGYSEGGYRGKNRGRGGGRGGRGGQQHYQSNDRYQQHQSGYNYSYDAGGYR